MNEQERGYVVFRLIEEPNVWEQFTAMVARTPKEAIKIVLEGSDVAQSGTYMAMTTVAFARQQQVEVYDDGTVVFL